MAGISLKDLHEKFRVWIDGRVRIDKWSINLPATNSTGILEKFYPANNAYAHPARSISFERTNFGALCTAELNFSINYRFTKALSYDDLPIFLCEGLLNNLYLRVLEYPAEVSDSIKTIRTPDQGVDVVIKRVEDNSDSDWLVCLYPSFFVTFNVAYADLDDLQPDNPDVDFEFNKLDIGIYRAKIGDFDTNKLDRLISIQE